jgi:hypothetical protein
MGRPVKWIATRGALFLADHPSRDKQAGASLALEVRVVHDPRWAGTVP